MRITLPFVAFLVKFVLRSEPIPDTNMCCSPWVIRVLK